MIYFSNYSSPIGQLMLASDGENLVGLWVEGQKYFGGKTKENFVEKQNLKIFFETKKWLDEYFLGKNPGIKSLSLAPKGSDFQRKIWEFLREVPYGKTTTYKEIAKKVAAWMKRERMSGQAVGGAIGRNPISIIIPCHRIVGADGNLTGYASGLKNKVQLLKLEGVDTSSFFVPKKKKLL